MSISYDIPENKCDYGKALLWDSGIIDYPNDLDSIEEEYKFV